MREFRTDVSRILSIDKVFVTDLAQESSVINRTLYGSLILPFWMMLPNIRLSLPMRALKSDGSR